MRLSGTTVILALVCLALPLAMCPASPAEDAQRELIVEFRLPVISIPEGVSSGGKELIAQPDHEIGAALLQSDLLTIRHAYPPDMRVDSVVYNRYGQAVKRPNFDGVCLITFPDSLSRNECLRMIKEAPDVVQAIAHVPYTWSAVFPDDPRFGEQWALYDASDPDRPGDIRAPEAWEMETGSDDVLIAVIDGGVWADHPDLLGRIQGETAFSAHATHIAGILAANTDNNEGIAGINWEARVLSKITDLLIPTSVTKVEESVDAGADMINCSFGGYTYNLDMHRVTAYAYKMDRVITAAKGNEQSANWHYPSDYEYTVAVTALNRYGLFHGAFSNYGNGVDVCAPGVYILSTYADPSHQYLYLSGSGTSFSAPHVAGVASLLKSHDPDLCNDDIINLIRFSAIDVEEPPCGPGYDDFSGYGRLNAEGALELLYPPNLVDRRVATGGYEHSSTDVEARYFADIPDLADGLYYTICYQVRKQVTFDREFFSPPLVWGRGGASRGYWPSAPNFGAGFTGVVDGSVTTTGCVLVTYVYQLWTLSGGHVGYVPCPPGEAELAYTTVGEYRLLTPGFFNAAMDWDIWDKRVKVYFSDPNITEAGYIIERRPATTGVWELVDTIPPQPGPYVTYWDTTYVGSETYSYRVKPYSPSQPDVAYTDEMTFKTQPRGPRNYAGRIYYAPVRCVTHGGGDLSGSGRGFVPLPIGDSCASNKVILTWDEPTNQLLDIDYYQVQRRWGGPYGYDFHYTDTPGIEICPNAKHTAFVFRIAAFDVEGDSSKVQEVELTTGGYNACPGQLTKGAPEGIDFGPLTPQTFSLSNPYPNPFNPETRLELQLPRPGGVVGRVYNALGRVVKTVCDAPLPAGNHTLFWDGKDEHGHAVSSGVYFFRLETAEFVTSRKLLLLK